MQRCRYAPEGNYKLTEMSCGMAQASSPVIWLVCHHRYSLEEICLSGANIQCSCVSHGRHTVKLIRCCLQESDNSNVVFCKFDQFVSNKDEWFSVLFCPELMFRGKSADCDTPDI